MKKNLFLILFTLSLTLLYGRNVLTMEEDSVVTEKDVIQAFVDELNKPRYAYALYDYEIYKTKDKQNHLWQVCIEDCSYGKVAGEEVILYVPNGYFTVMTFGGETVKSTVSKGVVDAYLLNDNDECPLFYNNFIDALHNFVGECYKWGSRFGLDKKLFKNVSELCFIIYDDFIYNSYILIPNLMFKHNGKYYIKVEPEILKEESNFPYVGLPIDDDYINMLLEMSEYKYNLVQFPYLIAVKDAPAGTGKYISILGCVETFNAYNQKKYIIVSCSIKNTEDKDYSDYFEIEIAEPISSSKEITEKQINTISSSVGDDVNIQLIVDAHKNDNGL